MRKADDGTGWWFRASTEQKLAQIDAAIELGMTAKQVAMNCGCLMEVHRDGSLVAEREKGRTVQSFAYANGRRFYGESEGTKSATTVARTVYSRKKIERTGNISDYAFNIFGVKEHDESLFDDYGAEV